MPQPVPVAFGNPTKSGNVQSPSNRILPPPVEKSSPSDSNNSESSQSGSKSNASRNNDAVNVHNANDNWQAATSGAQDWATDVPKTPKVPGAWGGSENNLQGAADCNNNGGQSNGGAAQNNGAQGNHKVDSNREWNNGGAQNNAGHPPPPQNGWDNANTAGNGNGNGDWNNNNGSQQQTGGAQFAQQNTWNDGNGAGNGDQNQDTGWNENQPTQVQDWGANDGNNNAGQGFGNPVPAFERPKSKPSLKSKHSNKAPSTAPGVAPLANAGMAPWSQSLATGSSMPMKLQAKPYWSIWKPEPESGVNGFPPKPEVAEGPIYNVPTEAAQRHMMSHQVLIGKPATYMHKTSRPKYMDTHENPYAAFIFNYRSKGMLRRVRREFKADKSGRGPRETAGGQLGRQCG